MILVVQQCRSHPHYSTGQRLALPWLPDCTSSGATLSFLPLDPTVPASFDLDADRDMLAVISGNTIVCTHRRNRPLAGDPFSSRAVSVKFRVII